MKKNTPKGFGGGGKNKNPPQTSISGISSSNAYILGIVSEGEIEGPVNGLKSVYFDETPIQNDDESINFQGFSWDYRTGTQWQSRIPGFADNVASETNVNTEVKAGNPITQVINNANLDLIRVRLGVILQEFPPNGGVLGLNVGFKIFIKQGNNPFYLAGEGNLGGRFPSLTEFEFQFPVNNFFGANTTYSVRVERTTPQDSDTTRYQRILQWRSLVQVVETKLRYPNSAIFGFKFDATQFQDVPNISIKLGGRKIQIPTNATITNTRGLVYTGIWNGLFYTPSVAVADPVWVLYDLLTNTRYGLGKYIDQSQIDKWALYQISLYCNQYVSDGYGGYEHRFLCNILLKDKEEAYKVISSLVSIFRGFSYWINGAIAFASDSPGSPVAQFTQADVEDGLFSYTRTGLKTRKTIALVRWLNPADFYRETIETVEDTEGIIKWGVRELELTAFACTSRGQARRAGMAALLTDRLEQESVTFKCRAYGLYTKPGDIIRIMDSSRNNIRFGGLIAIASTTTVSLDHEVELISGDSYNISVMLSDGTIQDRAVVNGAGKTSVIVVGTPFTSTPPAEANWIISSTVIKPQLYRVLNRVPVTGSGEMFHEITAIQYDASKYNQIESGWNLSQLPTNNKPPTVVSPPSDIISSHVFNRFGYAWSSVVSASWKYPMLNGERNGYIIGYYAEIKINDTGEWEKRQFVSDPSVVFVGHPIQIHEKYYVRVASVDVVRRVSDWVVSSGITITNEYSISVFTSPSTSGFGSEL